MEWTQSPLVFGYGFLYFLESIRNPVLDWLFYSSSLLGNKEFYIIFFPVLYSIFDSKLALRLLLLFLFSAYINDLLKIAFSHPRPDPDLISVLFIKSKGEASFGIPSGHSQNAVVLWGLLAYYTRTKWISIASLILVCLIPFSRLYNANHFVADVLAGMAIGGLILLFSVKFVFEPKAGNNRKLVSMEQRLIQIFNSKSHDQSEPTGAPLLLWLVPIVCLMIFYLFPEKNAARMLGVLTGTIFGLLLMQLRGISLASVTTKQKFARIICGLAGLVIVYVALQQLFPLIFSKPVVDTYHEFTMLRYIAVALWAIWGAPEVFRLLGLDHSSPKPI